MRIITNFILLLYMIFFFNFCVFLYKIIYTLNIIKAIHRMNANKIRIFIYKIYDKRIGFSKKGSYSSLKRLKKVSYCYCCSLIN